LQALIWLNKFIQKRKRLTCLLQPLIWLKNIPVQHLRSERTCVFPSTVPTGPLQVSVSVSLTVQVVTPLGVANKLMAPGVTERNRPEEGHFQTILRSIRSLSSTFPNSPAPRTETRSVTHFINHRLAVSPLLGKRDLSPKCAHVLCTLCKCSHVLCTLCKCPRVLCTLCKCPHVLCTLCKCPYVLCTLCKCPHVSAFGS